VNESLYVRRDAWFHRLDPRVKLVAVLLFGVAAVMLDSSVPMLAALALTHALALSTQVPATRLAGAWRSLLVVNVLIIVLGSISWQSDGGAALRLGPFWANVSTFLAAVTLAARVDVLAFGVFLLLWTTEQGELVLGMNRLGLSHSASLTLAVAMQFVPVFGRTLGEIVEAQQSRGLVIRKRNPISTARAYLPIVVPLLITALRMVDNLSMALVARGYVPGAPRSSRRRLRMSAMDWVVAGAALLLPVGAFMLLRFS